MAIKLSKNGRDAEIRTRDPLTPRSPLRDFLRFSALTDFRATRSPCYVSRRRSWHHVARKRRRGVTRCYPRTTRQDGDASTHRPHHRRPEAERDAVPDFDAMTPSLALRVTPTGHKSWVMFYRHHGRLRRWQRPGVQQFVSEGASSPARIRPPRRLTSARRMATPLAPFIRSTSATPRRNPVGASNAACSKRTSSRHGDTVGCRTSPVVTSGS